jgi:hypothetical protein
VSKELHKGVVVVPLKAHICSFEGTTSAEVLAQDVGSGIAGATWRAEGHYDGADFLPGVSVLLV